MYVLPPTRALVHGPADTLIEGVSIGLDIVFFRVGQYDGYLECVGTHRKNERCCAEATFSCGP
jgi:hypothetical protein